MVRDGLDAELRPPLPGRDRQAARGYERSGGAACKSGGQLHLDAKGSDRDQFVDWRLPGVGVGQVYQVKDQVIALAIEMAVQQARAADAQRNAVLGDRK